MGDNIANHMAYIYCIILYDKFDMSFKQICNFYSKVIKKRELWQSDEISGDELVAYCKKQNKATVGSYTYIEGALASTMYLVVPVLKDNYRFSNAKIDEFMDWTSKYIKGYALKNCNDELIRQIFIDEAHYDILLGEKV